jgi:hypothetical protein
LITLQHKDQKINGIAPPNFKQFKQKLQCAVQKSGTIWPKKFAYAHVVESKILAKPCDNLIG